MQKRELIQCALYITVSVIVLYVFGISYTSGSSMYPTIQDGSVLFINRVKEPKVDDIVIIWSDELSKDLCKRVIGLSGDHIVMQDGMLFRNGEAVDDGLEKSYGNSFDVTVGKNEVFVLGDNRNNSTDSRELGCLPLESTKGVCILNTHINKTYFIAFVIGLILCMYAFGVRRDTKSLRRIYKKY